MARLRWSAALCSSLVALGTIIGACAGGDDDEVAEPEEISAFCDTLADSASSSMQQSWVSLKEVAPTSDIESALEAMIAMNDPEFRSHARVQAFAQEHCGGSVRGGHP